MQSKEYSGTLFNLNGKTSVKELEPPGNGVIPYQLRDKKWLDRRNQENCSHWWEMMSIGNQIGMKLLNFNNYLGSDL